MTKYDKYHLQRSLRDRPYEIHPIWRGIGCLLIIISPIIAYSLAHILVNMNLDNGWYVIPRELAQTILIPGINFAIPYLYAKLMLTVIFLILGAGLLMIIYAMIYQLFGPGRFGPLDAKPVRQNPKRKRPKR